MSGILKLNIEQTDLFVNFSKSIGFTHCGFTPVCKLDKEINNLKQWLNNGFNAEMNFFYNKIDYRTNPENILLDAKTIIVLLKNYYHNNNNPLKPFKLSRYAYGIDYHLWMKEKLSILQDYLNKHYINNTSIIYCDTGPVMEKVWAKKAGLGWQGKNTLLINPVSGSFCFIGVIITNLEFDVSSENIENKCGTCNKCINACPTGALKEPGILDARKCISYLTVEKKGDFSKEEADSLGSWVFGCDICQEVCPYNNTIIEHNEPNFNTIDELYNLNKNIYMLSLSQFKKRYAKSAILRCGLKNLKRNFQANKTYTNEKTKNFL